MRWCGQRRSAVRFGSEMKAIIEKSKTGVAQKSLRLCRLMCGRPSAFRQVGHLELGYAQLLGRSPEFIIKSGTEARSASARQSA